MGQYRLWEYLIQVNKELVNQERLLTKSWWPGKAERIRHIARKDTFWKIFHPVVYNPTKAANVENRRIVLKICKYQYTCIANYLIRGQQKK